MRGRRESFVGVPRPPGAAIVQYALICLAISRLDLKNLSGGMLSTTSTPELTGAGGWRAVRPNKPRDRRVERLVSRHSDSQTLRAHSAPHHLQLPPIDQERRRWDSPWLGRK